MKSFVIDSNQLLKNLIDNVLTKKKKKKSTKWSSYSVEFHAIWK